MYLGSKCCDMSRFEVSTGIFENERALLEEWVPEDLPEREKELDAIAQSFHPIFRSDTSPNNLFVHGKTGQGKTAGVKVVINELQEKLEEADIDKDLTVIEVSFKDVNTEYQAVGELLTHLEEDTDARPQGHSLGNLNKRMFNAIDEIGGYVVLVLDEVDNLGTEDDLLYQIPRGRSHGKLDNARASIIGISNDVTFRDKLSPKVKDTLCDMQVGFDSYDANQLQTILEQREEIAFKDGVIEDGVIELCSAFAAQDQGSARQAIKFLHRAGELASIENADSVTEAHLRDAKEAIEHEKVINNLTSFTDQDQATLLALTSLEAKGQAPARTKHVYSEYRRITEIAGMDTLTSRSIRNKLRNLDTYGMVIANEKAGGLEGGKYLETELYVNLDDLLDAFRQLERFDDIADNIEEMSVATLEDY